MKKYIACIMILIMAFFTCSKLNTSYAAFDFWQNANDWYKKGLDEYQTDGNTLENLADKNQTIGSIIDNFERMVNIVGTTVIVLVTIFLGIKYMFGSFEAKADVKESFVTLLVACVFFFGWDAIWKLLFSGGYMKLNPQGTGYENVVANIFTTLSYVANFLAIGAVIYIGIRYIFAGAQGKAELKGKQVQFFLGVILAFCSVGFLSYVSTVVNSMLSN